MSLPSDFRLNHGRPQGGKRASPSLEIGTKKQKFL